MSSDVFTNTAFDTLEKDFQRVLNSLISDKSLDEFRSEYEKLHSALTRSHANEKKLIIKCRELNEELIANASKVGTAMKLSSEDENSIALLKNEIDKAWKMVDVAQEKEKKAKRTIQCLRAEIQNLTKLVEKGAGLNIGQESTVNELLRLKEELTKEVEANNKKMEQMQRHEVTLREELEANLQEKQNYESKLSGLSAKLHKTKQDLSRYSRRSERSEKQLLEIKGHLDENKSAMGTLKLKLNDKDEEILRLNGCVKAKDANILRMGHEFDALKLQCQELLEQLELSKDEYNVLNQEKAALLATIGEKDLYIKSEEAKVVHWRKQSDKASKSEAALREKLRDSELQRKKLKEILEQIKKDMLLEEKEKAADKRAVSEVSLDLKKLSSSLSLSKKKKAALSSELSSLRAAMKEVSADLTASNEQIVSLMKGNLLLEKKAEKLFLEKASSQKKGAAVSSELLALKVEQDDINGQIREERTKLCVQQQLYENIRGERNLFCQNLNEAQDEIAEMKRKFKIMTHQISQYKEETTNKDKALIKQHFEIRELTESTKSLEKQKMKKDEILQSADKLLSSQDTEIKTLRRTLAEAEATQKSQKQVFDAVVDERDILGAQLIRRNDELALLYDKIRLMESTLEKGEVEYRERVEDARNLRLQLAATKRRLSIRNTQFVNGNKLKYEVHHLQRELLQERTKVKALSEELENPINVHRWRKLSGSDPDSFEAIQKIQTLQKRLIDKTEVIVEKDLVIQEKERLYVELKNILARQPGPEVIEQLTIYQNTLKQRTRQIKSNTAEMNMLQTQLNQYKYDVQNLTNQLIAVKKKYYQQKKKEQLWKEQERGVQGADPAVVSELSTTTAVATTIQGVGNPPEMTS